MRLGHEVTLFASGDSVTSANLEPMCPESLRLCPTCQDSVAHHVVMAEKVAQRHQEFDVIHSHTDYILYPMARRFHTPTLTTLHGRLDIPDLVPLYEEFREMPVVSISNAQRQPLPWLNWWGTVYHGLPKDLYRPNYKRGDYLAFLGRISPEKRPHKANEIAIRAGVPIKIAAKIAKDDREYFESAVKPLLKHPLVEFLGEIGDEEKEEFLGNALAMLFPIEWPEPFGIVMIEAMACGTPVIASSCGSVPEVLEEGVSGFLCQDMDDAVKAVLSAESFDRRACRKAFEERFTDTHMANRYLDIYRRLAEAEEETQGDDLVRYH